MAGQIAGRLEIQILADVARLQNDLDRCKRAVGAASKDIAGSTRAINDNFVRVGASSGQARAGMQQLSFQIGDVATQFASGTKPVQIFGQQIGQVIQALGLMRGTAGGLIGFLAGPWGAVLTGAVIIVASFADKLLASGDASDEAAKAAANFTSRINDQTESLRANIRTLEQKLALDGINKRADFETARQAQRTARDALEATRASFSAVGRFSPQAGPNNAVALAAARAITAANIKLAEANKTVETAAVGARLAQVALVDAANATARLPKGERKISDLTLQLARLKREAGAGRISLGDYRAAENKLQGQIDATKKSLDKASGGHKTHTAAVRAAKPVVDELTKSVLEGRLEIQKLAQTLNELGAKSLKEQADELEKTVKHIDDVKDGLDDLKAADVNDLTEATRLWNDQLLNVADSLDDILGLGGGLGSLVNQFVNLAKTVDDFTAVLAKVGIGGSIGGTIGQALAFAGIGKAVGGGAGGALGGAVGGLIGKSLSKSLAPVLTKALGETLGKTLGAAVPVIGAIVGGLLGKALGGLLHKSKKGIAEITNLNDITLTGNSAKMKEAAGGAAGAIQQSIASLASALNATVGAFDVAIKVKDGKYYLNPKDGSGNTIAFGKDGEAAARAAILDAIKDGALQGISEGAKKLLLAGKDLDAQLQKALAFDSVFKELKAQANPLSAAIDTLSADMSKMTAIFQEAGATAEQFGQLQQLQALKLQQIIDDAGAAYRSTFFNDEQNVAFAQKKIASVLGPLGLGNVKTVDAYTKLVDSLDLSSASGLQLYGTLMTLVDEFGVLKDAADSAAQASADAAAAETARTAAIKQQYDALSIALATARGDTAGATALQRQGDLEGIDASLRDFQKAIWAVQDVAEKASGAREKLVDAYQRESSALQSTISKMQGFSDQLHDFRDSLFLGSDTGASRNQLLAKLMQTGARAGVGDESAIGNLPQASRDFLSASKDSAGSLLAYQRDVATVAHYVDAAIKNVDGQLTAAEKAQVALDKQVGKLIDISDGVISVGTAVKALQNANREMALASQTAVQEQTKANALAAGKLQASTDKITATNEATALTTARVESLLKRVIQDNALTIRADDDTTLRVNVVATV